MRIDKPSIYLIEYIAMSQYADVLGRATNPCRPAKQLDPLTGATTSTAPLTVRPRTIPLAHLLTGAGMGFCSHLVCAQQPLLGLSGRSVQLEEIVVTEQRREAYGTSHSSLSKLTESLLDTPQSITSLPRNLLDDRGAASLNDALRDVPGITLGAGEFRWQGNAPSIRGFSARDDMYLDGLRDFGSYPRDPFNLETVEVLLGPSSVLFGRGSTGGAVNQVTKRPQLEKLNEAAINIGSDATLRSTLDFGRPVRLLGDGAALRLNALAHKSEVAERDGSRAERMGLASSLAFGLGTATELTLSQVWQTSDDRPDYGLPWLDGEPAPVPRHNYYGFDDDYLKTDAAIATLELRHAAGDALSVHSQLRHADYSRESRITEPLIRQAVARGTPLADVSVYRNVFLGKSEETFLATQTTVNVSFHTGRIAHTLVGGVELGRETSAPVFAWAVGVPEASLLAPDSSTPFTTSAADPRLRAESQGDTRALLVFDTLKLGARWRVTLGTRHDRFDIDYAAVRYPGPPTPFNAGTASGPEAFAQTDHVTSWRAGVVYKWSETTSFYAAGSTSFNPSGQEISFISSGRNLAVSNASLEPEQNRGVEIGAKADVHDGRLSLVGALFEIKKTNARVADPANPGFNLLAGALRARGVSFNVQGTLTARLHVTGGYTHLDTEVIDAGPGGTAGAELEQAPEHSFSIWADYAITSRYDFGLGARYVSETIADNRGDGKRAPGYRVFDAMVRYRISDTVTLKANLTNLTDAYYFEQLHRYHVVPGPGFAATFAIDVAF